MKRLTIRHLTVYLIISGILAVAQWISPWLLPWVIGWMLAALAINVRSVSDLSDELFANDEEEDDELQGDDDARQNR